MTSAFFPFTLYASDELGSGHVAGGQYQLWQKYRSKDRSYYLVDIVVSSRNNVTFVVCGMASSVYGGRGDVEYNVPATLTDEEMLPLLEIRAYDLAVIARVLEWEEEEQRIIEEKACAFLNAAISESV